MTAGQRIEQLVKWTGLSVHAFAIGIGLKRSENIYQIKKGNNGISRNLAEMIVTKYPTISKSWLIAGEGEMIANQAKTATTQHLPYFSQDVISLIKNDFKADSDSWIKIPFCDDVDCFAAPYMSDSMAAEIPLGAVIVCQKSSIVEIIPGVSYLVVTNNFIGVRYIRLDENNMLRLEAANKEKYDSMKIEACAIKKLYIVKSIIINKSI